MFGREILVVSTVKKNAEVRLLLKFITMCDYISIKADIKNKHKDLML